MEIDIDFGNGSRSQIARISHFYFPYRSHRLSDHIRSRYQLAALLVVGAVQQTFQRFGQLPVHVHGFPLLGLLENDAAVYVGVHFL
jgi:hypothetical protein